MLTNVARASLNDELVKDYKSFLLQRGLRVWHKDAPEARITRERLRRDLMPDLPQTATVQLTGLAGLADFVAKTTPEQAANAMLCAVNQAAYLLRRQLESQGRDFAEKGGFTEQLYAVRVKAKNPDKSDLSEMSDKSDEAATPICPKCGKAMRRRIARMGTNAGSAFWGCSGYPKCRGTRAISEGFDEGARE